MKKIISLFICIILCISITACNAKTSEVIEDGVEVTNDSTEVEENKEIVIDEEIKDIAFSRVKSFLEDELKVNDYEISVTEEEQYCYTIEINGKVDDKTYYGRFLISKADGNVTEKERVIE